MSSPKKKSSQSPEIHNRRATHDYQILETLECGVQLAGTEVKAVRESKLSFADAYVEVSDQYELWWVNARIEEFSHGNLFNHKPVRKRKLLAHGHEIAHLKRQVEIKGLTLIPLKLYFKKGWAKLLVGLAKGKDHQDKRNTLIERTHKREMDRALKLR